MAASRIGEPMRRVEDDALLRGRGRFVDDIPAPGAVHAAFFRSPHAHARLLRLDTARARSAPGVVAVLTLADIRPLLRHDRIPLALPSPAIRFDASAVALASDELTYVGEPIAVVIATSRGIAEDAIRMIDIEAAPLPAVIDPVAGLAPGAPRARIDCPDNLVARHAISYGDVESAFGDEALRVALRFRLHKGVGGAIEPRAVLARFDEIDNLLTIWAGTQMPHRAKAVVADSLELAESEIRVIAPDVGGGFGPKAVFHPEELVIAAAARMLQRPVKWIGDRAEDFTATAAERDSIWDMEAACDAEGRLRGIRGTLYHDHGANTPYGVALPYNALTNMIGPYIVPACDVVALLCLTNAVPAAPTRGAGRPQGTFVMERLLDAIARGLDVPRDEIRRRNLIARSQMPYATEVKQRDGSRMIYDSGDYPECQERALILSDWNEFGARKRAARRQGRYIGIGLCNYVEATGRGPYESAALRIGPSGRIVITTGATAQGQGLKSMLSQIAAETFGVDAKTIQVIDGDTAASPLGLGAFASRQTVTAGNAIYHASRMVAQKALEATSVMLKVSADDLMIADGEVRGKGMQGLTISLADIAKALGGAPGMNLPGDLPPGLAASVDFQPAGLAYTNGTHVCEVEVDIETGQVRVLRYFVVHDCGRVINPLIVDGQIQGAVAHGLGMSLLEWMQYDSAGQPLTASFADYLLPDSCSVPGIEIAHIESPSPMNPLGVKGAAESGTIGAPAAIASAIEDALSEYQVTLTDLPLTPSRIRMLIEQAMRRASV